VTKGFGFSAFTAILISLPQSVVNTTALLIAGVLNNKTHRRFLIISGFCLFPISGMVALLKIPRSESGSLLAVQIVASVSGSLRKFIAITSAVTSSR
jgi:hypothetical protein